MLSSKSKSSSSSSKKDDHVNGSNASTASSSSSSPSLSLSSSSSSSSSSYPKKQFDYLGLVVKSHPLTLKQRCFLVIINNLFNNHNNNNGSNNSNNNQNNSSTTANILENLSILPLELKEELVHFMLEYRLFNGTKISHSEVFTQNILDTRLRSIDFSVIRSKINQNDPTKELLRACHSLQRLNFSYCYEINDNILKTIISSLNSASSTSSSSMSPSASLVNISDEGSNVDTLSSITAPNKGAVGRAGQQQQQSQQKQSHLQKLKNKILKRRKETPSKTGSTGVPLEEERPQHPTKQKQRPSLSISSNSNNNNGPSHSSSTDKITDTNSNISDELSSSASSMTLSEMHAGGLSFGASGLEYLSLRQCTSFSSDHMLRKLLRLSPSLTYLDISGCSKVTHKTIQAVTQHCTRLRTLSISNLRDVLTHDVTSTFNNMACLTALDISQLPNISSDVLDKILTPSTSAASSVMHLSSPRSAGISPAASPRKVPTSSPFSSSSTLQQQQLLLFHYQQQLQHYQQQQQTGGAGSSVSPLPLQLSPRSLDDHVSISGGGSPINLQYPAMIQSLNLAQSEIEDESLSLIGERCPTLHSLDVSFYTNQRTLETLGLSQSIVKACPRMRVFSCLSSFHLKDITILEALKKWTLLEVIELTDCTSLTSAIIAFVQQPENHIHLHLRFLFFGSAMQKDDIDEFGIMCKLEGKTTLELLETQQQVTLEDLIDQGWVNVI
ncbi:hypothetical protein DFA_07047 [Cavenderia fasciculata]|uniref:Leucine-rich repeat-containing protein n=1 Tax=Cavenderia fasciculata TaxID=261658 RepID=F4PVC5_CACFS|nr:uncharacterized protein DFA_07047 [Cavenderia fasciculata]EGG19939.1 hypothetical protein DFA_07047 [Cavenderia fasciculata]|eukprot:XP_004366922.1 hypothetical protein DFA_07047 [Cavenderia fasciculata]